MRIHDVTVICLQGAGGATGARAARSGGARGGAAASRGGKVSGALPVCGIVVSDRAVRVVTLQFYPRSE